MTTPSYLKWILDRILAHEEVTSAVVIGPDKISVSRKGGPPFVVGLLNVSRVTAADVKSLTEAGPSVDFIASLPKEAVILGEAFYASDFAGVVIGRFGDLLRAISILDIKDYENPETRFLERGLGQHGSIISFHRLDDCRYHIKRTSGDSVVAAMIPAYEATVDHIRSAYERYGAYDVAVLTNPNSRATSSALMVAEGLRVEIHSWPAFLGWLGRSG